MSETIEIIKKKLEAYPDADYEVTESSIFVNPKSDKGFTVLLTDHGDGKYTVNYDFWSEKFDNSNEAINCFAFGLSKECRLKLNKKGTKIVKWTVESKENDKWKSVSSTGSSRIMFFRKTNVIYLQNDLITVKRKENTDAQ